MIGAPRIFWPEVDPNLYFFDPKWIRNFFTLTRKKISKPETRPEQNQKTRNPTRGEKNWPDPPLVLTTWPCFMHRNLLLFPISFHSFTPKTWSQQHSFIFVSFHKRHSVPTYCVATRSRHEFWPPFFLLFLFAAAVLNFNLHTINGHTSVCKKKRKFAIVVRKMHVCAAWV